MISQVNGEARAFADVALQFDVASMGVDDGPDKAQAEPESPLRTARSRTSNAI